MRLTKTFYACNHTSYNTTAINPFVDIKFSAAGIHFLLHRKILFNSDVCLLFGNKVI